MPSIGEWIAAQRCRRGWSQEWLAAELVRVAERSSVTRHEVSRWERGERRPRFWLPYLASVFDADLTELERLAHGRGAGTDERSTADALRMAHEWLVSEPPQVAQVRAGRRIGEGTVAAIEARVQELRLLDDQLGGSDTLPMVESELARTRAVLEQASYDELTGRRLLAVLGELFQLAGWVASDAGKHQRAERHYLDGMRAAQDSGHLTTAANLLSSLSYQAANVGAPDEAVLLARTASRGVASFATGRPRALLAERVAWAHARAGEAHQAETALAEAEAAYGEATDNEPAWVYWLDRTELGIMAGRVYVELGRPLKAVPLLSTAIASYPPERQRETGLYHTWLAQAYTQANEHDAARAAHQRAASLASTSGSARLTGRVDQLADAIVVG